ncbi:BRO family protein [Gracilibacillus xinjiangensis]|uniref:BRO family protein n=1 Tax=Gracilibacillus xinjiangensis TaxID=1193282 RepID=A0ABV8WWG6_9BACI
MQIKKQFNDQVIHVEVKRNRLWFVAQDICNILDLRHVPNALKQLETERKDIGFIVEGSKKQKIALVDAEGLRILCHMSESPQADFLENWLDQDIIGSQNEDEIKGEENKTRLNKMIRRYTVENNLSYKQGYKDFVQSFNLSNQTNLKAQMELYKARFNLDKLTIPEYLLGSNQLDKGIHIAKGLLANRYRQVN